MKKVYSFLMIYVFAVVITYGNISGSEFTIFSDKCNDSLLQTYLYDYNTNSNYKFIKYSKYNNDLHSVNTELKFTDPDLLLTLDRKIKKELKKLKVQKDHLNVLLTRKRRQYQLYKFSLFGQLTSPVNIAVNYHKSQPPRIEGFGLRLRF